MDSRRDYLKVCPRHKAVLVPIDALFQSSRREMQMRCPVCVHLARVTIRLWIASYREGRIPLSEQTNGRRLRQSACRN